MTRILSAPAVRLRSSQPTDEGTEAEGRSGFRALTFVFAIAAAYFLGARRDDGRPVDPVAGFHLGNGARLERINWLGDTSEKGIREGAGLMVNYLYDLDEIERNHEAYANAREIVASTAIRKLAKAEPRLSLA